MSAADAPDREVATIRKNSRESIRVALRSFKGQRFVDVRVYFDDGNGELKPTGKGVALQPAALPEVIRALQEAAAREDMGRMVGAGRVSP